MAYLIFVLYDSITNSVFDGQIAQPLLKRQKNNPEQKIIIISFEKKNVIDSCKAIINRYPSLTFRVLSKNYFITRRSLAPATKQLGTILKTYESYSLIARGPMAGYVCLQAVQKTQCNHLTIQARGLLAEEYRYAKKSTTNFFLKMAQLWRAQQFAALELAVYKKQNHKLPIAIEVVSKALEDYLITTYHADSTSIILACLDIPAKLMQRDIQEWRSSIRNKLGIAQSTTIYCYNGSLKPWQCPRETLTYFKQEQLKNKDSFLLILTQDKAEFEQLIFQEKLEKYCKIITLHHKDIYNYLAACDIGLVFREQSIVNWVSRPTKILEYQAVGLSIAHNNTIAMLCNNS